jgi:hypothetical protein
MDQCVGFTQPRIISDCHRNIPGRSATVIIAGGRGSRAQSLFAENGIKVVNARRLRSKSFSKEFFATALPNSCKMKFLKKISR